MRDEDNDEEVIDPDLQAELDRDFPLGDGTADSDAAVTCPYCGDRTFIALDAGSGARQDYVEDCQVCCRPWRVVVAYAADGTANVTVSSLEA